MQGEASWLPVLIVLLSAAVIALMAFGAVWISGRYRWRRMDVRCPEDGHLYEATVKMTPATGTYVDVERCAKLANPDHVDCRKRCLHGLNHQPD